MGPLNLKGRLAPCAKPPNFLVLALGTLPFPEVPLNIFSFLKPHFGALGGALGAPKGPKMDPGMRGDECRLSSPPGG